jgi:hypothetical protein
MRRSLFALAAPLYIGRIVDADPAPGREASLARDLPIISAPVNTELDREQSLYRCRDLVLSIIWRLWIVTGLAVVAPLPRWRRAS